MDTKIYCQTLRRPELNWINIAISLYSLAAPPTMQVSTNSFMKRERCNNQCAYGVTKMLSLGKLLKYV